MNVSSKSGMSFLGQKEGFPDQANYEPEQVMPGKGSHLELVKFGVVFIAFLFLLLNVLRKSKRRSKNEFGNPVGSIPRVKHISYNLPISEALISIRKWKQDGVKGWETWRAEYGRIFDLPFPLSPGKLTWITDANVIQKVLNSSNPHYLSKPRNIYKVIMSKSLYEGLVGSVVENWLLLRKAASKVFSYKALLSYIPFMNEHARTLTYSLDAFSIGAGDEEKIVDLDEMYKFMYSHTIKITSQMLMGSSFDDSVQYHEAIRRLKTMIAYRFNHPFLLVPLIWWFHPLKREMDAASKTVSDYTLKKINEHKLKIKIVNSKKDDSEDKETFVCVMEEMLSKGASNEEIFIAMDTFMKAGHETTAMSLNLALFHLAKHVEHQAICQEEIDSLINSKIAMGECTKEEVSLSMDDLTNLKYLERCLLESIRMTPAIPFFMRKLGAPVKVNENLVLEVGTVLVVSPWLVHKEPEYFPNPEIFDPDRFLPENVKERHPCAFIPFSSGPRNCIGWKQALIQLKIIIAHILYRFDLTTTDELADVKLKIELTLQPERNFNLTLRRREIIDLKK